MGRGRNTKRGEKWNLATLRDFVGNAVEADVPALAALGESCHPAHALVRAWCVIRLYRLREHFEGADWGLIIYTSRYRKGGNETLTVVVHVHALFVENNTGETN